MIAMNKLVKVLDSRLTGTFCTFFAIANRIIFTTLYSQIGADTKLQLTYAENLIAGKGMGITKYFTNDLDLPVFDTQQEFPPGFSIVIVPFLKLFGGNEYKAVMAFDIMVAIFFVIIVRHAGKKAGLPAALNNIVTLIGGCVQYLFFTTWQSTEAICVCLLLCSIIQTINIINRKSEITKLGMIGYGLLFFLPFFFRYIYLPITIFFPLFIFLSGVLLKSSKLKAGGLKILSFTVLFLTLLFTFSLLTAGNALYLVDTERGFFIKQLGLCYPFLPASFISIDFGAQLIQIIFGSDHGRFVFWLSIINPFLLILFLLLLWKYIRVHKISLLHTNHSLFIFIGSSVSIIILVLLVWFTVTYKERASGFFVAEPRYFSFIYAFTPLALFICLYHYRSFLRQRLLFFLVIIGLCCLTTEVLHGIYYNIKILRGHPSLAYLRESKKRLNSFPTVLKEIKDHHPGQDVIVCTPEKFYLYAASTLEYKVVFDYANFFQKKPIVSSKSILVVPVQSQNVMLVKEYIEAKKPFLFSVVAGTNFYIEEINPQ